MFRITSRYIVREAIPPFCLSLAVFTFLLMLDPIRRQAEELIGIGIDASEVVTMLAMLVPYSLGLTIPMALLVGALVGLGRLSGDRETVAMQACGISIVRILSPLLVLAVVLAAVDCYILVKVVPEANQRFRDIFYRVTANRAEGEVKPRVFQVGRFPDVVLYVQEVSPDGWNDVFLHHADPGRRDRSDVYVAERGRVRVDAEERTVAVMLRNGERHRVEPADPAAYEVHAFEDLTIQLDAESLFPEGISRGLHELTITELWEEAAVMREAGVSPHAPIMDIHEKFSIPVACFVFVLLAAGIGVSSRKDGRQASFALAIGIIFAYYIVMYSAEDLAKGQYLSPHLAMWLPNIILGLAGIGLVRWRSRSVEEHFAFPWRDRGTARSGESGEADDQGRKTPLVRSSGRSWSAVNLLDWYVTKIYLLWLSLGCIGLLGVFYIATFLDLTDKLFKGQTTLVRLLEYFWYATPQFFVYVLPIAALVATLVTIGLLTKTSELTVMKACGISLYRAALPILAFSLLWSGVLFAVGESVLARANRRAETLNREIRTGQAQATDTANRTWLVNDDGDIYHYLHFDAERRELGGLTVYEFAERPWSLARRTHAAQASYDEVWQGSDVWVRDFAAAEDGFSVYGREAARELPAVAPPAFFTAELPEADLMSFRELGRYIVELTARGFDVVNLEVALHRKVSFPLVTVILTLIAIPFAVTTGPRGALYGVGAGIALSFSYFIVISVFGALGSAGVLTPPTAAWAPNVLFGASAAYALFAVRT